MLRVNTVSTNLYITTVRGVIVQLITHHSISFCLSLFFGSRSSLLLSSPFLLSFLIARFLWSLKGGAFPFLWENTHCLSQNSVAVFSYRGSFIPISMNLNIILNYKPKIGHEFFFFFLFIVGQIFWGQFFLLSRWSVLFAWWLR